jgi:hypothetical protein
LEKNIAMHEIVEFAAGGYRFIKGSVAYSMGVIALPGFRLERVRFQTPVPLGEGFQRMAGVFKAAKRPAAALAACELRSPAPFTEAGFKSFNERYFALVHEFGFPAMGRSNPIARTNVCPLRATSPEVCMHAFTYATEEPDARPSFVLAGAVDLMAGDKDYRELIVARDQVDAAGIRKKARHALEDLEGRLSFLDFDWAATTANGLYCVHDIFAALTEEIAARGAAPAGITWHLCRPPIEGLEFEMDTRSVSVERVI